MKRIFGYSFTNEQNARDCAKAVDADFNEAGACEATYNAEEDGWEVHLVVSVQPELETHFRSFVLGFVAARGEL